MLTTILKEDVSLIMDPDSPLNRAHQKERQAERYLNAGRYEEASGCYQTAAELIKEAMTTTVDASALFSLRLQYESHLKQPLIIKRRQEESLMKAESVHSPPWTTKARADQSEESTTSPSDIPISLNGDLPTPTNGYSEEPNFSLEEAYNSLEETRPLLECLRQHSVSEGDKPKYFAGEFLEAYDQNPAAGEEHQVGFVNGRKMPKSDQIIIEELQVQNKELCQHIVRLIHNMDHCEQENRHFKSKIDSLEQELATLKSQMQSSSETSLRDELGAPFSMQSMTSVSVTTPPTEIPPLPPLELPDFDVN